MNAPAFPPSGPPPDIAAALDVFMREAVAERSRAASDREALETTVREMRFGDVRIIVQDAAGALVAAAGPLQVPAAGALGRERTLWLLDEEAARGLPEGLARPGA